VGADKIELTSAAVPAPKYVRYAWGDNPACNVLSNNGLPLTPFRTDSFEMVTKPKAPTPAPAIKAASAAPAAPKKA
jgi:sialate O-acetylesterase